MDWIPVAQAEPTETGWYLITWHTPKTRTPRVGLRKYDTHFGGWQKTYGNTYGPPVAWMPLPDPYVES